MFRISIVLIHEGVYLEDRHESVLMTTARQDLDLEEARALARMEALNASKSYHSVTVRGTVRDNNNTVAFFQFANGEAT